MKVEIQIGANRYPAKVNGLIWEGENFKLSMRKGKTLESCLNAKGERVPECEHVTEEASVTFECGGLKRSYEKWRITEGC
jgi:hypothetical protein